MSVSIEDGKQICVNNSPTYKSSQDIWTSAGLMFIKYFRQLLNLPNRIYLEIKTIEIPFNEDTECFVITKDQNFGVEFSQGQIVINRVPINTSFDYVGTDFFGHQGVVLNKYVKPWPEAYKAKHWRTMMLSRWIDNKKQAERLLRDINLPDGAYLLYEVNIGDDIKTMLTHRQVKTQQDFRKSRIIGIKTHTCELEKFCVTRELAKRYANGNLSCCAHEVLSCPMENGCLLNVASIPTKFGAPLYSGTFNHSASVRRSILPNGIKMAVRELKEPPPVADPLTYVFDDVKVMLHLQNLNDPTRYNSNIVRLYGFYKSTMVFEMAMDECSKLEELASHPDYNDFYPKLLPSCIYQLASAISYLHTPHNNHYVIHNDIHVGNILVSHCISEPGHAKIHIKLTDFGQSIIKHIDDDPYESCQKEVQTQYCAIEQLDPNVGMKRASRASDVWQFGLCLWTMIMLANDDILTKVETERKMYSEQVTAAMENGTDFKQKLLEYLQAGGRPRFNEFQRIFGPLESIIRSCWESDKEKRPTISNVQESLSRLYYILNLATHVKIIENAIYGRPKSSSMMPRFPYFQA